MAFVKRRDPPAEGSIPAVLGMFTAEVRFYREIGPHITLRVPTCYHAQEGPDGTVLELEDLSTWAAGGDPAEVAELLGEHHRRWHDRAVRRWPWLRRAGAGADLIGKLYDDTWPVLAARPDLTRPVRDLGQRLVGQVPAAEHAEAEAGPVTLIHGDASTGNMRTAASGEIAFLDWEDVRAASGLADLGWLLVSSVEPQRWDEVINAYRHCSGLTVVLPSVAAQGLLSLADHDPNSELALAWIQRLDTTARRLG